MARQNWYARKLVQIKYLAIFLNCSPHKLDMDHIHFQIVVGLVIRFLKKKPKIFEF